MAIAPNFVLATPGLSHMVCNRIILTASWHTSFQDGYIKHRVSIWQMTALTHTNTKPKTGCLHPKKNYHKWLVVWPFGDLTSPVHLHLNRVKREKRKFGWWRGEDRYGQIFRNNHIKKNKKCSEGGCSLLTPSKTENRTANQPARMAHTKKEGTNDLQLERS